MKVLANLWHYSCRHSFDSRAKILIGMVSIVMVFGVLGAFHPAKAAAQSGPQWMTDFDGTWFNVDPATRGLVEIVIHGAKIHPYGACHPDPCDWGVIKTKSFGPNVNSSAPAALLAKQTTSFSKVEMTLSLELDGRLRAEWFTHFTDGSGRADYRSVNYFARGRMPYRGQSSF